MSQTIFTIPVPSTAFLDQAKFAMLLGRKCSLSYSYEGNENYSVIYEQLIFDGIESFKSTYYTACSIEMIAAYDKVIELGKSDWLSKIAQNLSNADVESQNLKHLRIYFDDGPCYEFICRQFDVVRSEQLNDARYQSNL